MGGTGQGSGCRGQDAGFRAQGSRSRVEGSGFGGGGHLVGVFLDVDLDSHKLPLPAETVRSLLRHLRTAQKSIARMIFLVVIHKWPMRGADFRKTVALTGQSQPLACKPARLCLTQYWHQRVLESQLPHTTVKLISQSVIANTQLTMLWGCGISKTH